MSVKKYVGFLFFLLVANSCVDYSSPMGNELVNSSFRNVYTDTCTVVMSTIRIDSIATSGSGVSLVGRYSDGWIGDLKAVSYVAYDNNSFDLNVDATYVFDSLTLSLYHSGAYWGDTLSRFRFGIHELKENIEPDNDDDDSRYNISSLRYDERPLARADFYFNTGGHRRQEIRLPDEFGRKWFDKIMDQNDEDFESEETFRNYFKGLVFVPDASNNLISGFSVGDSNMVIRMYYHILTNSDSELNLVFTPNASLHFNQCEHVTDNVPLGALRTEKEVRSSLTDNKTYVSGLPGFYTKIEIPFLNNLMELGEKVTINSASLLLYPEPGSYGTATPLTPTLSLFVADVNNITQSEVTDIYGTEVQTGSLSQDEYYQKETYYSFDLTNFMQDQLGKFGKYKQHLQLVLSNDTIDKCFNTVVFRDNPDAEQTTRLQIQYQLYNPY